MADNEHRLVLLRHGETEWSRARKHTGRTDLPLTAAGEAQARTAAKILEGLALRDPLVISSPRQRAVHTAELAGFPADRVDDDLAEWDYGDYEGITTPQIREHDPDWTIWTGTVPGGETAAQVSARADRVLDRVGPELRGHDVVLVGHGHFSRALIARWLDLEVREGRRFFMSTAGVSVLGHDHDARTLRAHNLIAHLDDL
ncbi:2,3-bisphosphoglycerate-dependent phosphoglycerate mutase [Nocardia otitidiscaviarum]|uniref:2,3-bisphosphoglycerate-dependent phosphoglycerate mutase n=1 Tax=Nocardia otitidiscaviarum TaxID=1823 RepID=A0A378Y8S6_9NOCA|nr:acid phosphatase [Nocardia otitidiscaviarum]SUA72950.1 2,3-bisphosphoglycerate-dependent phosphoglycerate mutase [Nocardia otitidiscaviarum]